MKISKAASVVGSIDLPGDKSISHRAAMFAAVANGRSVISNYATSVDCGATLECMRQLGAKVHQNGQTVTIDGVGRDGFTRPAGPLDCGNSGTTMRLLAGILAGQDLESVMIGDASLSGRPMKRIIEPLTAMGARISSIDGHAPLTIRGGGLTAIEYTPPVASAQIKSCVLLAGLNARGRTTVIEHSATRDHTERMLRWFGVNVETDGPGISVTGPCELVARLHGSRGRVVSCVLYDRCRVPSGLKFDDKECRPQSDPHRCFIRVLEDLGVDLAIENERLSCNEPVGDIVIRGREGRLGTNKNVLDGTIIANVIDEIPVLAVLGTRLDGGLEVRGASELRVKESDRIAAVVESLRKMGATVDEFPDGFRIERSTLHGAKIDSRGDHRIAMAFGVAGLLAEGETEIEGAECADVSFPAFFETLRSVVSS